MSSKLTTKNLGKLKDEEPIATKERKKPSTQRQSTLERSLYKAKPREAASQVSFNSSKDYSLST